MRASTCRLVAVRRPVTQPSRCRCCSRRRRLVTARHVGAAGRRTWCWLLRVACRPRSAHAAAGLLQRRRGLAVGCGPGQRCRLAPFLRLPLLLPLLLLPLLRRRRCPVRRRLPDGLGRRLRKRRSVGVEKRAAVEGLGPKCYVVGLRACSGACTGRRFVRLHCAQHARRALR